MHHLKPGLMDMVSLWILKVLNTKLWMIKSAKVGVISLELIHTSGSGDFLSDVPDESEMEPVIQGFNFTQLRANYPELRLELNSFQRHLITGTTEVKPLKAWQMRDLGLQAAQTVMDVAIENDTDIAGLLMIKDLSQNFPSRA